MPFLHSPVHCCFLTVTQNTMSSRSYIALPLPERWPKWRNTPTCFKDIAKWPTTQAEKSFATVWLPDMQGHCLPVHCCVNMCGTDDIKPQTCFQQKLLLCATNSTASLSNGWFQPLYCIWRLQFHLPRSGALIPWGLWSKNKLLGSLPQSLGLGFRVRIE